VLVLCVCVAAVSVGVYHVVGFVVGVGVYACVVVAGTYVYVDCVHA